MAEKGKIIPMLLYALIGVFGFLAVVSLFQAGSFAWTVPNASAWLLAIAALNWGIVKLVKPEWDLIKMVSFV